MLRFYKARLGFLILLGILLVGSQFIYAQCPNAALTVSPATTTICSGSTVPVTIGLSEGSVAYQLRNNATNAALSGYFQGNGANLIINSDAIAANVTIKVYAINPISFCALDLTNVVVVTANQPATVSNAGIDQALCSTSTTLAGNPAVVGTGQWTFAPGGNPNGLPLTAFSNTSLATSSFTGTAGQTYTLRWTITNGVCAPSVDDVQIRLDQAPTVSVAGGNQTICGTTANLNGNSPSIGVGQWSFAPGGNPDLLGVISDVNSRTSLFTGTAGQSYILRWTISNGVCPSSASDVTINFQRTPTVSNAGGNQDFCGTTVTLAANAPAFGTGQWSFAPGGNWDGLPLTAFSNTASFNSTFTGTPGNTYTLRWTITNGVCTASIDDVQIRLDEAPTASVAGGNQTICGTTTNLNGNSPSIGIGQWSFAPGGNPGGLGVISDPNSRTSLFTGTAGQSYILRWTISNGVCTSTNDDVQIKFDAPPPVAIAGPDQTLCSTSATLAGNTPAPGTGLWTIVTGSGGSFALATNATTLFSGTPGTTYVLRWTITNGICAASFDDVTIKLDANPSPAASAGSDQTLCSTSATLAGNTPAPGTGTWTVVSGAGGSFVNANSPTTVFNGVSGTTYNLRWTISNGVCTSTNDDVQIKFDAPPPVAIAGPDQTLCSTSATLAGNTPAPGTGLWTIVTGSGGSFALATNATTLFSGTPGTTYVLRWTITNGICAASFDDVTIKLDANPSPAASAGSDQTLCSTSATLAGNTPAPGTGTWTVVSGAGGSFVNANSPTTVFNGVSGTTYNLRWTISNGVCTSTNDDVQIKFDAPPPVAIAGPDQTLCSTSATLAGNTPAPGTGLWTIVTGSGGSFALATNATTLFSGTPGTTYVLRWTITNGICAASFDDVTIKLDANPSPAASAGSDQTLCSTSATLAGNTPAPGTGTWTVVSGAGGSFVNANSPTTVFNGVSGTTYNLRWTISNGVCTSTNDDVQIKFDAPPPVAIAGPDQTLCSTSATLAGNTPAPGTGLWTIVTGSGGSFALATNATTLFSGTPGTTYVLRWTITNGICAASFDDVTIKLDANPSPAASAGSDQTLCSTSATLAGNTPAPGTGTWTVVSGAGGSFVNANSPTTVFNGVSGTTYNLRWTISNGVCTSTNDDVQIKFDAPPPVAIAGPDQTLCSTSATLAGNTPAPGTGLWTIVTGSGGSFALATNATTLFSGTPGTTYVLRWTITNGICAASFDDVTIKLDANPSPAASAGSDQTLCSTSATLAGNTPAPGTGTWTVVSGAGGSFVNANSPTTVFNGVSGTTYNLRWTISNGVCTSTNDDVQIKFDAPPPVAIAGPDQTLCSTSATLAGNTPAPGTGLWTIVTGSGGSFALATNATTLFSGTPGTTYVLRWTITNGICAASFDDVTIKLDANPSPAASAGSDQTLCSTSATLAGNTPAPGTGTWTVVSGAGGSFVNANSPTTVFNGVSGTTYNLRWTISNGVCTSTNDDVQIKFDAPPPVAIAGPDQTLCSTSATLAGNTPAPGTGLWTIMTGLGGSFALATNATTLFSGTPGTTYVLRWTITNGICAASFDDVTIKLDANPSPAASAGSDQTLCSTSATLAGNTPAPGTGTWTVVSGAGGSFVNANSPTTVFNGVSGTTYNLRWTISNGVCTSTNDDVQIKFDAPPPVAIAGPDQTLCSTSATLAGNTPAPGTGLWTIVTGSGGSFALATNATTLFSGTPGTTYVLRWTITNGVVCTPSSDEVTIKLDANPSPAASAGSDQTLCSTSATLAANGPTTGIGTWTIMSGAGGSFVNANSPTTVFNGVSGTSYNLRWTISNGVCTSTNDNVQIKFDAQPTAAAAGPNQSLCTPSAVLGANAPVLGTGQWTILTGAGGSFVNANNPTTVFNGVSGTTYALRWTTTNGMCSTQDDAQIQFYPIPDVAASDKTICSGSNASVLITNPNGVAGTTFSWTVFSSTNVLGANPGNGSLISQILSSSDGVNPGTVVYRITPSANSCPGNSIDVTVTVTPKPSIIDSPTSFIQEICSGVPFIFTPTASISGTTYTWTATIIGTLTGVNLSGSGATITDNPVNATNSNGVIIYSIKPTNGGCDGTPANLVVTVRPVTTASATDQTICSGESTSIVISNPNSVTGTTYSWTAAATDVTGASTGSGNTISQLLVNTHGSINGTVAYTITPSVNGCPGPSFVVNATVKPVPVMTNPAPTLSQQICSGEALSFVPTSTIGGATYSWDATISGTINAGSVTTTGTGSITDAPVNTGNVSGIVTYRIRPNFNGCIGLPVDLVVTVKPLPSATASNLTICSGQTATINITSLPKNVAGTTFAWSAVASLNVTGWAASGNGSVINQTLSTTNASIGTVTYTITPTANSCNGPTTVVNITVNPIATANAGADFAVCEPVTIPLSGSIGGSAGAGTWSIVPGFGFGTISTSTTTGTNVTATYTVHPSDIGGQVKLALTSNDPDGVGPLGPCSVASDEIIIDINRRPVVTVPADYTLCQPASIVLSGTLSGSAVTGAWSKLSGGGTLSVSSVTGSTVTASYTPSAGDVANDVQFRLTSNSSGVCAAGSDDILIHINRAPTVNAGPDFEVCEVNIVNLNGSMGGSSSLITWTGGLGGTYSNSNSLTSTYTVTAADIAAGGVTFTITSNDADGTGPSGPCVSATDQVFVKINKLPEVFLFGLQPAYAENNPVVSLDGIPVGGIFTGSGITAGTNQFDPGNASSGSVDITYTYTNPATGCTNSVVKSTIVNPVTSIDFDIESQTLDAGGNPQICANSKNPLQLIGYPAPSTGYPTTAFISPDIPSRIIAVGSNFYIDTDGLAPGAYKVQYVYTNSGGATDTLTKAATVLAAPKAVIDFNRVCIVDSLTYTDASFIPVNPAGATIDAYNWSYGEFGNGNDGVTRNPRYKYNEHGNKTVVLGVTTSQGCSHDTTKVIRVGPLPDVAFTWSKVCSGLEVTEFRDATSTIGSYSAISEYEWNFGDGDVLAFGPKDQNVPPATHAGRTTGTYTNPNHDYNSFTTFNVQLTVKTEDGCTETKQNDVIILDYVTPTASGGYRTDFETGSNPWVVSTTSTNSSWIYGPPTGNVIQPSAPDNRAWWTGNNPDQALTFSTYNNNESSEVLSPCLNLTDLKRPMISLDFWSDFQAGAFDGALVQFSTDDGNTWQTIGGETNGYGINWYDTRDLSTSPGGENNFAWSGGDRTEGWRNARFNLDQIPAAERDLVRFRIAFASNGDNPSPDQNPSGEILNGFAFDNIYIGEKNRNVLIEHFTNDNSGNSNNSDQYLETMYDNQILAKDSSDFIPVQYHMLDDLYYENEGDPNARATMYGVSQAPTTIMDGIQGQYFNVNFNGLLAQITAAEIDRRALEDPLFRITVDTIATGNNNTLQLNVRYTYIDSLNTLDIPVTFHAALVERGVNGNGNIVRKLLLRSEGSTIERTWDASASTPYEDAAIAYTIDVPIVNPDNLYILAFIQDNSVPSSPTVRRILQSVIVKAPRKVGPVITGVEDNPTVAELRGLVVYPNPASQVVNLHSDINFKRDYTWKLIDQRGALVMSGDLQRDFSNGDQQINVGDLSNGMYIMTIQTGDKSVVHKKIAIMNGN